MREKIKNIGANYYQPPFVSWSHVMKLCMKL